MLEDQRHKLWVDVVIGILTTEGCKVAQAETWEAPAGERAPMSLFILIR